MPGNLYSTWNRPSITSPSAPLEASSSSPREALLLEELGFFGASGSSFTTELAWELELVPWEELLDVDELLEAGLLLELEELLDEE